MSDVTLDDIIAVIDGIISPDNPDTMALKAPQYAPLLEKLKDAILTWSEIAREYDTDQFMTHAKEVRYRNAAPGKLLGIAQQLQALENQLLIDLANRMGESLDEIIDHFERQPMTDRLIYYVAEITRSERNGSKYEKEPIDKEPIDDVDRLEGRIRAGCRKLSELKEEFPDLPLELISEFVTYYHMATLKTAIETVAQKMKDDVIAR